MVTNMAMPNKLAASIYILRSALALGIFAVLGVSLLSYIYLNTHDRILSNERASLLSNLNEVLPHHYYNNNLYLDTIEVSSPSELGTKDAITVYRARMDGKSVAIIFSPVAPDGYSGSIRLLVGIHYDGTLAGVRVLTHRETPGLGDKIEARRSQWIFDFSGKSLTVPNSDLWRVKRDGGEFDSFTGATITPRAVVKAVHKSLQYFQRERDNLFIMPQKNLK
jgi:Na+-translocating ferredoxin:NAD+ oxidoreductase subunit G